MNSFTCCAFHKVKLKLIKAFDKKKYENKMFCMIT